jgi:hypothetical protein
MWIALVLALAWSAAPTVNDLTFLTRDGCVNTPDVVNNLDDALAALKLTNDYQFVNIGKLPKDDPRTGYPTPGSSGKGKTSLDCRRRSYRTTCRVGASTRAEFRPSKRFRSG